MFVNAEKDPRTAQAAAALKAIAQSVVNMPVNKQGGLVALLYLNHATAREWGQDEIDIIRRTRSAPRSNTRATNRRYAMATSLLERIDHSQHRNSCPNAAPLVSRHST